MNVFANADKFYRGNTCTAAEFRAVDAERRQKLREWEERQRRECGARR